MKSFQVRHGDILLRKTEKTGNIKTREEKPQVILALGEQTGHAHVVTAEPGTKVEEWTADNGQRYVMVEGGIAVLDHEEHGKVELQPGTYEVRRQREFDDAEGWRRVQD